MDEKEKKETVSPPIENRFLKLRREKDKAAIAKKASLYKEYQKLKASRKKEYLMKLAKCKEILVADLISEIESLSEVQMSKPDSLRFKSEAFADFIPDEKGIPVDRGETITFLDKSGNVVRSKTDGVLLPISKWKKLYKTSPMSKTTYHKLLTSTDRRLTCIIGAQKIGILNQDHHEPNEVRMFDITYRLPKNASYCLSPDGDTLICIDVPGTICSIDLPKGKAVKILDSGMIPGFDKIQMVKFRMDNITLVACTRTNIFEINTLTWKFKSIYSEAIEEKDHILAMDINEVNGDIAVASATRLTIITEKGTTKSCVFKHAQHAQSKDQWNYLSFSDMRGAGLCIISPKLLVLVGPEFYNSLRNDDWRDNEPIIGHYVELKIEGVGFSKAIPLKYQLAIFLEIHGAERMGHAEWVKISYHAIHKKVSGHKIVKIDNNINLIEGKQKWELGKRTNEETDGKMFHSFKGTIQPRTITFMQSHHSEIFRAFDSIVGEMAQAGMRVETKNGIDFELSWFAHGSIE